MNDGCQTEVAIIHVAVIHTTAATTWYLCWTAVGVRWLPTMTVDVYDGTLLSYTRRQCAAIDIGCCLVLPFLRSPLKNRFYITDLLGPFSIACVLKARTSLE